VKCRIPQLLKFGPENPSHGQTFHLRSLQVLHCDSNLRLVVDLGVLSGGGKAAELEPRGRALQTPQQ